MSLEIAPLWLIYSGLHGYSHENPTALNVQQQREILEHTYKQLTEFCGKPPTGSVAPWWEVSKETAEMLLDKGISYGKTLDLKEADDRPLIPPPR